MPSGSFHHSWNVSKTWEFPCAGLSPPDWSSIQQTYLWNLSLSGVSKAQICTQPKTTPQKTIKKHQKSPSFPPPTHPPISFTQLGATGGMGIGFVHAHVLLAARFEAMDVKLKNFPKNMPKSSEPTFTKQLTNYK